MLDNLFKGIFDSDYVTIISIFDFLMCLLTAIVIGIIMSVTYMHRTRYTKSFILTLGLLPAVVCVVIMMVNGNVGTGVAVAGAFSLVRFRSVPGTAKEICTLFLAMGAGLITGMGYLGFALLYSVIMCLALFLYSSIDFSKNKSFELYKTMTITIPEDLNYSEIFDDIFEEFTSTYNLIRVKTSNMGSMFKLTYDITLKKDVLEKDMIDMLRCRNGNLEICISKQDTMVNEL